LGEHHRYRARELLQNRQRRPIPSYNDIWLLSDKFGAVAAHSRNITAAPANIDAYVAADRPARLLKSLVECRNVGLCIRIV
jgi:hypothetical protein